MDLGKGQLGNERGVVLVTALMVMALLTVMGISAMNTSDTELKITGNQRVASQAFYLAEAGIQHAVGVFKKDGLATLKTPNLLTDKALGSGIYSVTVLDQSSGSEERFLLTSTGTGSGVTKTIEAVFSQAKVVIPPLDGAFGIYGDKPVLNLPKKKEPIDGRDWDIPTKFNCSGAGCSGTVTGGTQKSGLYVSDPTFTDPGNGLVGDPAFKSGGGITADEWTNLAKALIPTANKNPTSDKLGTRDNPTVTYIDQSATFSGSADGAGILIIGSSGDLKVSGNFHYEGIVIVLDGGNLNTFTGTGDLFGAVVMVGDNINSTFSGNGMAKYSSKAIDNVKNKIQLGGGQAPVKRVAWQEKL